MPERRYSVTRRKGAGIIDELYTAVIISVAAGFIGSAVTALFLAALEYLTGLVSGAEYMPGFLIPSAGAFLAGLLIIRFFPGAGGDGTNQYIDSVNNRGGRFRASNTLIKIPATLITLGFYGSGGIVGPLSRIGAGLNSALFSKFLNILRIRDEKVLRLASVCGVSAVVSSIFHSPLGGALFASEITRKDSIVYSDLFPATLSGCTAVYLCSAIGSDPVFDLRASAFSGSIWIILLCAAAAVLSGGVGILFIASFEKMKKGFESLPFGQPGRAVTAGIVLSVIWAAGAKEVLGTSLPLMKSLAAGGSVPPGSVLSLSENLFLVAGILLLLKIAATSVTVGSGLSGGVTGPLIVMGTCFSALFCSAAGISGQSGAYNAVLCASIGGILSSALNVPIAAVLISVSIFDHSYIIPAVVGAILPFLVFKGRTVFAYAENGSGRAERGITGNSGEGE
jgi:CIC family chloride channel protein